MGELLMSMQERRRLELLSRVRDKQVSLAKVAEVLALSYRHVKRLWQRYRAHGDAGLVHRSRGRPSNRRIDESKRQAILRRYQERYSDFGPTLASEHLAREGLAVDAETLRRWLIAAGLWQRRRKRRQHRQWRARKEHRGELVQLDGSEHDWFEGRRARAVLMVMIDDATNRTYARFFEGETTEAAMETFARYTRRYGLPQALYADLDSIYRVNPKLVPSLDEQLANQQRQTQFGRAMKQLGVAIVPAYSPQAKGRVERRNGFFQDRLIKEMRLAGCTDLASANVFLEQIFLPDINRRFCWVPAHPADLHRPIPPGIRLAEVLSWEESRVLTHDWTIAWRGRWFQILRANPVLPAPGRRILVRQLRSGKIQLLYQGQKLRWRELPERPKSVRAAKERRRSRAGGSSVPTTDHPWRRFGIGLSWRTRRDTERLRKLVRGSGRAGPFAPATDRASLKEGSPPSAPEQARIRRSGSPCKSAVVVLGRNAVDVGGCGGRKRRRDLNR